MDQCAADAPETSRAVPLDADGTELLRVAFGLESREAWSADCLFEEMRRGSCRSCFRYWGIGQPRHQLVARYEVGAGRRTPGTLRGAARRRRSAGGRWSGNHVVDLC